MAPLDGLDLSYRVARCEGCGFAFADRLAAPDVYGRYYRALSKYDVFRSVADIPAAHRERARSARMLCEGRVERDAVVVDLGCGPGVLLDELRKAGWNRVLGLDPAPRAAEQALELFGLHEVRSGTLEEAAALLPLAESGLVCLTGVLEHLPRLREDLEALLGSLPHQAKVLIEVPALEAFVAERFEPFGEFSLEHLQYFCAGSLAALLRSFGFRPLAIERAGFSGGITDSLLGLFARQPATLASGPRVVGIEDYVRRSAEAFERALQRVLRHPSGRIVIYGAGSHTARLLPALLERGAGPRLVGLLDANPNLQGKRLGPLVIEPPRRLESDRQATVLISTFRSQEAVARDLEQRYPNPLLRLY